VVLKIDETWIVGVRTALGQALRAQRPSLFYGLPKVESRPPMLLNAVLLTPYL